MKTRSSILVLCASTLPVLAGCSSSTADSEGSSAEALGVAQGVDYSFARPAPSALRASGVAFAARYLAYLPNGKVLSASEASSLHQAGIAIVLNWEQSAADALQGFNTGVSHAREAIRQANALGAPANRPIYFSVDFDAAPGDQTALNAYFDGVASVIGRTRTGAYGGYWVIKRLFDAGKIHWGWQTYAWSGGNWDSRAQLRQVQNDVPCDSSDSGRNCDHDTAMVSDFGQWGSVPTPGGDPCAGVTAGNDGVYCGASTEGGFAGGDPSTLYTCQGGRTTAKQTCANRCFVAPAGQADGCVTNPCANVPAADNGAYCGRTTQSGFMHGAPSVVYDCENGRVASSTACAKGCTIAPAGSPDHCN